LKVGFKENKNPKFDGAFLFGIATTKINCCSSRSSRLPKRENVYFFADCADAEKSGFLACQRCEAQNINFENLNIKIAR